MLHRPGTAALLAVALICPLTSRLEAAIATFGLDVQSVTGNLAILNVRLTLDGNPGDEIDVIQLSVIGSDRLLTAGDTDFSRFSFSLNPGVLPDWVELFPLGDIGLGLFAPDDPLVGPYFSLLGSAELIGQLRVDLTGIPAGTDVFVTLAAGPPGFQTDVGGTVAGLPVFSFRDSPDDDVQFAAPVPASFTTVAGAAVPEPSSWTALLLLGGVGLAFSLRARRSR